MNRQTAQTPANHARRRMLATIHIRAAEVFGPLKDPDNEQLYRDWLYNVFRVSSCADLDNAKLGMAAGRLLELKQRTKPKTGRGPERPTPAQWTKLEELARARGWAGLDDKRLAGFVKRTANVDAVRFLTRRTMTFVITGLTAWNAKHENR